jgi:hypothetical protein
MTLTLQVHKLAVWEGVDNFTTPSSRRVVPTEEVCSDEGLRDVGHQKPTREIPA